MICRHNVYKLGRLFPFASKKCSQSKAISYGTLVSHLEIEVSELSQACFDPETGEWGPLFLKSHPTILLEASNAVCRFCRTAA